MRAGTTPRAGGPGIAVTVSNARAQLLLAPDAGSPRSARVWVTGLLDAWGRSGCVDAVRLVVTELVANAVVHARSRVTLRLSVTPGRVRCAVSDAAGGAVTPGPAAADASSGRGLLLVDGSSDRWGVDHADGGTTVWVEWTGASADDGGRASDGGDGCRVRPTGLWPRGRG